MTVLWLGNRELAILFLGSINSAQNILTNSANGYLKYVELRRLSNWTAGGSLCTTITTNQKSRSRAQIIGCYYLDDCFLCHYKKKKKATFLLFIQCYFSTMDIFSCYYSPKLTRSSVLLNLPAPLFSSDFPKLFNFICF